MIQGCHLEGPMARKGGTPWCSVTISPPSLGCLVLSHTSSARLGTQLQEEGLVPDGEEGPEVQGCSCEPMGVLNCLQPLKGSRVIDSGKGRSAEFLS